MSADAQATHLQHSVAHATPEQQSIDPCTSYYSASPSENTSRKILAWTRKSEGGLASLYSFRRTKKHLAASHVFLLLCSLQPTLSSHCIFRCFLQLANGAHRWVSGFPGLFLCHIPQLHVSYRWVYIAPQVLRLDTLVRVYVDQYEEACFAMRSSSCIILAATIHV